MKRRALRGRRSDVASFRDETARTRKLRQKLDRKIPRREAAATFAPLNRQFHFHHVIVQRRICLVSTRSRNRNDGPVEFFFPARDTLIG